MIMVSFFQENVFSFQEAYIFRQHTETLSDFLWGELEYQLQHLERLWQSLNQFLQKLEDPEENIEYRLVVERILFRLEEVIRFVEKHAGPKILNYIGAEIHDFVEDRHKFNHLLTQKEFDQVHIILIVLNSYFRREVTELKLITVEKISQRLQSSMEPLLRRS